MDKKEYIEHLNHALSFLHDTKNYTENQLILINKIFVDIYYLRK